MIVALIAPELIIAWATRQFFSARKTADKFNDEFGAQVAQTPQRGWFDRSHEKNSQGTSAPHAAHVEGRLHVWTLRSAVTYIQLIFSQNGQ